MSQIVECVPNFSEGRNKEVIEKIAEAIRQSPEVSLLDVDPGESTNRTVYTFVGSPKAAVQAALNAATVAHQLIDMTQHKGEHPRLGAMDVCPFIPLRNTTEEDCIRCAKELGDALARNLGVPVYLYGAAATSPARKTVPEIRAGEYEKLPSKLNDPEWTPDFGPTEFKPRWGASIVGVRKFLIAYNINLIATKEQAHRIALIVRSQRSSGKEGKLKNVQGMGWWLQEANIAQVSLNLTDYEVTPIHVAFEEVCSNARDLCVPVAGSEIVGLVPLDSLLQAAHFYMEKENLMILEEDQKVRLAVSRLGLSTLAPFIPEERIIEYRLASRDGPLLKLTTRGLIRSVAARSPAPGGGSVAALVGALGAALGTMAAQLSYGKKQWEAIDKDIRQVLPTLYNSVESLEEIIDKDTDAFNSYMAAMKISNPDEREQEVQNELRNAIMVPLGLARKISSIWDPLYKLAGIFNMSTASDLQVAARCLETATWGAYHNVYVNLRDIKDRSFAEEANREARNLVQIAQKRSAEVLAVIDSRQNENQ